jgi:Flp pilus assembly protein TadG
MVEYAFIFLFVMAVVLGIMDFGRALYAYHFADHAAKSATRWAAVNGYTCGNDNSCNGTGGMNNGPASASDIQAYVANRIPMGIDPTKLTTTVPCGAAGTPACPNTPTFCSQAVTGYPNSPYPNYPGCTVEVQVSYQFSFLFPLVHISPITLSSTSEMVIVH